MAGERSAEKPPSRVVIENVEPSIDNGRFPAKRVVGESVDVTADVFCDGHEVLSAFLQFRSESEKDWREVRMRELGNDAWAGSFAIETLETYYYRVIGWIDHFRSWRHDFEKKLKAGQDIAVDLLAGVLLIKDAATRALDRDAVRLREWSAYLQSSDDVGDRAKSALDPHFAEIADKYSDRSGGAVSECELRVSVDRPRAVFSSWYEMFPRSCTENGKQGTFRDCEERIEYVASMGFNILYLPPVHPIGRTNRKGKNNNPAAQPGDPGSPWAIGASEGGHKQIDPALGTLNDFHCLQKTAAEHGIELAMDIAFQSTPDHPYVQQHPQWFKHRPDGSIQYAENPPKKYQDIYPFDFESEDWRALWEELKSVVMFWAEQGVRVFRVDNPHTKAFAFWEWMIAEVRKKYPEAIFLAEAFTRPKVMYRLAKLGFTQSYTYFTWRNTKLELTEYMTELTKTNVREFFRPNFWPNTPDILPEYLHYSGRPAFASRLVLAATLSSNFGIYGPAFELLENQPIAPGKEEYLNSEKYEVKHWDIHRPDSLRDLIGRVNRIRNANAALQSNRNLQFHQIENEQMIAYSKATDD